MALTLHPKPDLSAFIRTCTPLAIIPSLEAEMQARVEGIAAALVSFQAVTDPMERLAQFLKADQDFLGIVLALTNLSQEKFLRVLSAQRFATGDYAPEWGISRVQNKLRDEPGFAEALARLFTQADSSLRAQIAPFYLEQLTLPDDWPAMLANAEIMQRIIRRKLTGEYNDNKGDAVEALVRARLDDIQQRYGVSHSKGQVRAMGINKEVDHVIPSLDDPYVLVMTSYMETTSSSQTARANEQSEMLGIIERDNRRYTTQRVFINFVDGAGWLARRSDLRKLHAACHYILNLNTLDQLEAIICQYVPEKYFKIPKPEIRV